MDIILWIVGIIQLVLEAITSGFIRNDEKWSVGRIVFVSAIAIAIVTLGYVFRH